MSHWSFTVMCDSLVMRSMAVGKKDGFKVSFWPVLQHSLNPSVTLLNWVKLYNAVCTPTPIHRLCTQTFSPPQKTNVLLGIEPAAPPPSQSPSRDVNPLHQSTTPYSIATLVWYTMETFSTFHMHTSLVAVTVFLFLWFPYTVGLITKFFFLFFFSMKFLAKAKGTK